HLFRSQPPITSPKSSKGVSVLLRTTPADGQEENKGEPRKNILTASLPAGKGASPFSTDLRFWRYARQTEIRSTLADGRVNWSEADRTGSFAVIRHSHSLAPAIWQKSWYSLTYFGRHRSTSSARSL